MEEKLDALSDAIDFIKLARQEIEGYVSLSDIVDELDDIKSELVEKYDVTMRKAQKMYEEGWIC